MPYGKKINHYYHLYTCKYLSNTLKYMSNTFKMKFIYHSGKTTADNKSRQFEEKTEGEDPFYTDQTSDTINEI